MGWILGLVVLYLLVLAFFAWASVHPFRIPIFLSPGALGTPQETFDINSGGTRLRAWWVQGSGPNVAVFCHGYVLNRAEMSPQAFLLWKEGLSCLLFDFRGHGSSEKKRSTMGWMERHDVREAVLEAKRRSPGAKVVLVGSSMGAAACAFAQAEDPDLADVLVLDSAYGSFASAASGWWRFVGGKLLAVVLWPVVLLAYPLTGVNPFRVDVADALKRIGSVPVLFMHGDCDDLALPVEAVRNFEAVPGPKRLEWFVKCQHSEGRWVHSAQYNSVLLEFLREHGMLAPATIGRGEDQGPA